MEERRRHLEDKAGVVLRVEGQAHNTVEGAGTAEEGGTAEGVGTVEKEVGKGQDIEEEVRWK